MALERVDRLGHAFGRGDVTETPTGHRVGLAEAVDGQGQVVDILAQRRDADVLRSIIDELLVNLVGKNQDVLVERDIGQAREFVLGIDGAVGLPGVLMMIIFVFGVIASRNWSGVIL